MSDHMTVEEARLYVLGGMCGEPPDDDCLAMVNRYEAAIRSAARAEAIRALTDQAAKYDAMLDPYRSGPMTEDRAREAHDLAMRRDVMREAAALVSGRASDGAPE